MFISGKASMRATLFCKLFKSVAFQELISSKFNHWDLMKHQTLCEVLEKVHRPPCPRFTILLESLMWTSKNENEKRLFKYDAYSVKEKPVFCVGPNLFALKIEEFYGESVF